jgi:MinD superfamily P-loop ATPase
MHIVVASGKGGTGKTLVAVSLALVAREVGDCALLDADVEVPNAALFLKPVFDERMVVERLVPVVDASRCDHCGRCAEVCQHNALAVVPGKVLVFKELCHGCGSCALECPTQAIREVPQPIGLIEAGRAQGVAFAQGTLNVGQAMATPVIRALKRYAERARWDRARFMILDAPPGTACPVIESLRGADVALLVTEPTPFGLHDLKLAVEVARDVLGLPVGVVINKDGLDDPGVDEYCHAARLPILSRIPLRRDIAAEYAVGTPLVQAFAEYRQPFLALLDNLGELAQRRPA